MSYKEKINKELIYEINLITKNGIFSPIEIRQRFSEDFIHKINENKYHSLLVDTALTYKQKRTYGRLTVLILLCFSLDKECFEELEAKGVLLSGLTSDQKLMIMLSKLRKISAKSTEYSYFEKRFVTYIEFANLCNQLQPLTFELRKDLKNRSPFLVKSALCCSELFFMSTYFGLGETRLPNWLIPIIDQVRTPENLASIISYLIWEANRVLPLNPFEFEVPIEDELSNEELGKAVLKAKILYEIKRISKLISCFQYSIQKITYKGKNVYKLVPPFLDFEYYLRLGYIRDELGKNLTNLSEADPDNPNPFSLNTATKYIAETLFDIVTEWVEEPYPRLRVHFPYKENGQFLFLDLINNQIYHEEKTLLEIIQNEHLIIGDHQLTENLKISSFVKIFKLLLFFFLLNINSIIAYKHDKKKFSHNSLIRVHRKDNLLRLSSLLGLEDREFEDFIKLVSWDSSEGQYYDLQYSPFLKCRDSFVSLPSIFSSSNILRNTQVSNKIRFKEQGDNFTEICTRLLKTKFSKVVSEKRIKYKNQSTEIDIIVFEKPYLYLFECKYSVPPCGFHELRDIWNDLKKGIAQQQIAYDILINEKTLNSYLAGWFPGTKSSDLENLTIKNCVILSGRNFSGMNIGNISIRDFHSLRAIITEQKTAFSKIEPLKKVKFIKYSFVGPDGFNVRDLNDYLSPDSKFFQIYNEDMAFATKLNEIIPDKIIIAEERFIYQLNYRDPYQDYIDKMDRIGFFRLPDEEKIISFPISLDEMKDRIGKSK